MTEPLRYQKLEELHTAIIFARTRIAIEEPYYEAIGHRTFDQNRIIIAGDFLKDIQRILRELKYARYRIEKVPAADDPSIEFGNTPEDHLLFYRGRILELIYQAKEKICQLAHGLTTSGDFELLEGSRKKSIVRRLRETPAIQAMPEMVQELGNWATDNSEAKFKRTLDQRTSYVHGQNRLTSHLDYIDVKGYALMLSDQFAGLLSDAGRQILQAETEEKIQKMYDKARQAADAVLSNLETHVEKIAVILLEHVPNLPTDEATQKKIAIDYQALNERLKFKNDTDLRNLPEAYKEVTGKIIALARSSLQKEIKAIYLVGSLLRNEVMPNLSNLDLVVIVNAGADSEIVKTELTKVVMPAGKSIVTNMVVSSEYDFNTEESTLLRLRCHTDAQLIIGENTIDPKTLPKPNLFLGELIANGVIAYLPTIQQQFVTYKDNPTVYRYVSRELAKTILRALYALEVANNPQYTNSLTGIIAILKSSRQAEKSIDLISACENVIKGGNAFSPDTVEMFLSDMDTGKLGRVLKEVTDRAAQIRAQEKTR